LFRIPRPLTEYADHLIIAARRVPWRAGRVRARRTARTAEARGPAWRFVDAHHGRFAATTSGGPRRCAKQPRRRTGRPADVDALGRKALSQAVIRPGGRRALRGWPKAQLAKDQGLQRRHRGPPQVAGRGFSADQAPRRKGGRRSGKKAGHSQAGAAAVAANRQAAGQRDSWPGEANSSPIRFSPRRRRTSENGPCPPGCANRASAQAGGSGSRGPAAHLRIETAVAPQP